MVTTSMTVPEGRLGQQAAEAAAVADAHDAGEVARQQSEPAEGEVPWPREEATHDEVPTWLGCSGCDCEKQPGGACKRLPNGSEAERVERLKAEWANHERTYSRTLLAASQ